MYTRGLFSYITSHEGSEAGQSRHSLEDEVPGPDLSTLASSQFSLLTYKIQMEILLQNYVVRRLFSFSFVYSNLHVLLLDVCSIVFSDINGRGSPA